MPTRHATRNCDLARSSTQSFVIGVAPKDQLRRAFLYYLERERAHPYRPYLHYNSWYDTAWQPFALERRELSVKRSSCSASD